MKLGQLNAYRLAILLALILAACDLAFALYSLGPNDRYANGIVIHIGLALVVALGLWLQSRAIRVIGGLFFILAAGSAIWPLLTERFIWSAGAAWVVSMGLLSLALAYLLLLSKEFSHQFAFQLSMRPAYKRTMLNALFVLIIAAGILATFRDIYNLAATP